jgi:SAM-dependent methyltransferase
VNANSDHDRRASFDGAAEAYDRGRPGYPEGLVAALTSLAGIGRGSRVLEIGPGTGQLSVALAERGASLLAVELGPNLAALATRKLARFPDADVLVADFDDWTTSAASFDAVVAATSFHWLDASSRVAKCAALLRPGGALAIIETCWGVGAGDDPFFVASQACYARWTPDHDPKFRQPRAEDVTPICLGAMRPELVVIAHRRCVVAREYSSAAYCELLSTFSNLLFLDPASRAGFLACISNLIDSQFGGKVIRNDLYDLSVARRAE